MLRAEPGTQGISLSAGGALRIELRRIAPLVTLSSGEMRVDWQAAAWQRCAAGWTSRHPLLGVEVTFGCEPHAGGVLLTATLANRGTAPVAVEELAVLHAAGEDAVEIGAGAVAWSVLRNGYQSWSGTRSYRTSEADRDPIGRLLRISTTDARHPSPGRRGVFRSDLFSVIKNRRSGEALCLGFLDSRRAFGAVSIDARGGRFRELSAACDFEGRSLAAGETLSAAPLWVGAGPDEHVLLDRYVSLLGERMGARVPQRCPTGWCSWYYYFTRVSEQDVLDNLVHLSALRERFRCDYVQVDDGYQPAIGDWLETNAKFPHGMGWLAARIRDAGFDAGIWLAPFIARRDSRLFREHPDWFVRDGRGRPLAAVWNPMWGLWGQAYALDTTRPAVLDWMETLGRTIAGKWGYHLLKLDFLFAAALPGQRHDARATRAEALRRGLEAIRRGAGSDAFLLGCGCPLGPAVGVVDAMRIGPDVAPFWSLWFNRTIMRDLHGVATKHAIRNVLTRAFMHRRLWLNDPDCLMVRAGETRLSPGEVRCLAAAIALTDGMLVVSDRMDRLPAERIELLQRTARLTGGRATALDLFERDMPELVSSEGANGRLLGVFNFADVAVRKRVDAGALGAAHGTAREIWSGGEYPIEDGWIELGEIEAHDCRVLALPDQR